MYLLVLSILEGVERHHTDSLTFSCSFRISAPLSGHSVHYRAEDTCPAFNEPQTAGARNTILWILIGSTKLSFICTMLSWVGCPDSDKMDLAFRWRVTVFWANQIDNSLTNMGLRMKIPLLALNTSMSKATVNLHTVGQAVWWMDR